MSDRYLPVTEERLFAFYSITCPECEAEVGEYCNHDRGTPYCNARLQRWVELRQPELGDLEKAMLRAARDE